MCPNVLVLKMEGLQCQKTLFQVIIKSFLVDLLKYLKEKNYYLSILNSKQRINHMLYNENSSKFPKSNLICVFEAWGSQILLVLSCMFAAMIVMTSWSIMQSDHNVNSALCFLITLPQLTQLSFISLMMIITQKITKFMFYLSVF